ncbi:MAG: hypothetical protein KatS3mg007_0624 [Thermoanaerobaculum sp.]|nr:MAG: hypothetical protein KatS3mg007_0624 [Thermoanaerobaculum sp.]
MFLGRSATVLVLSVGALLAASVGAAEQPKVADKNPQGGTDAAGEVRKVVDTFAECWNRHDMNAFAELFAPDAEFVNVVGLWWKGKDEIKRAHERTHATMFKNSRLTITEVSVRFPVAGMAIARSRWVLEGHVSPEGAPLPLRSGILLTVLTRSSGTWLITDAQNTDVIEGVLSRPQ